MIVFRELTVDATSEEFDSLVVVMESNFPPEWTRDQAAESNSRAAPTLRTVSIYCFRRNSSDEIPSALLIFAPKSPKQFYVSNIIPLEEHEFTPSQYNSILVEFVTKSLAPATNKLNLQFKLTEAEGRLEFWISSAAQQKFRRFLASANRSTGSAHPADQERWHEFVLSVHQNHDTLAPETLRRWMVEVEHWDYEVANQLAQEFEYGLNLLAYLEKHKVA